MGCACMLGSLKSPRPLSHPDVAQPPKRSKRGIICRFWLSARVLPDLNGLSAYSGGGACKIPPRESRRGRASKVLMVMCGILRGKADGQVEAEEEGGPSIA